MLAEFIHIKQQYMTRYVQSELGSTTCSRACRFLIARGAARGGLYTSARAHHWESEEFRFKTDSQTRHLEWRQRYSKPCNYVWDTLIYVIAKSYL